MVKRESYFYFTIAGFPVNVIVAKTTDYCYQNKLVYFQVRPTNYIGAFRILDFSEAKLEETEMHFKRLNGKIQIEGVGLCTFFFTEISEIKIQSDDDKVSIPHIVSYFKRNRLPELNITDAGDGRFYLYSKLPHNVMMVDHHLEGLKNKIKMPHFNRMIRFYRNHELTEGRTLERMAGRREQDEAAKTNIEETESRITAVEARTVMVAEPLRRLGQD
uniref:Bro-N domain-containing protein n=1 Tax=Strongyloides papillosus TaxID=174720 RepID=A0A0N5BZV2_STREA